MKGLSSLLIPAHSTQPTEETPPSFHTGRAPPVEVSVAQVMGKKKMTHIVVSSSRHLCVFTSTCGRRIHIILRRH